MNEQEMYAQSEFGISYDQLGVGEKEWVDDTIEDLIRLRRRV